MKTPKQLIQAFNWFAIIEDEDGDDVPHPLVCWALFENNEIHGMISVDGNIVSAKSQNGFKDYETNVVEEYEIESTMLN